MSQFLSRMKYFGVLLPLFIVSPTFGQFLEQQTVQAATEVFNDTMSLQRTRIPKAMLADAHGVAIIPNVLKGSFVLGARHGRGLLFIREPDGVWHAPVFISLTGGNIGWQAGVQSSDIVLVFKTQKSVQGILSGKLTIGADAAAAAGPVGRQGSVGTDGTLRAEIYSYSRSRGLFAGVSIDGSVIKVNQLATGAYYGNPAPGQPVAVPPAALQLTQAISAQAGGAIHAVTATQTPALAHQHSASEADVLRGQLVQIAPELYEILTDQWKSYLGLPSSLFLGGEHPNAAALQTAVSHFDVVANNQQYQQLAARAEFQSVYGILRHYQQALAASPSQLQLPPPPRMSELPGR